MLIVVGGGGKRSRDGNAFELGIMNRYEPRLKEYGRLNRLCHEGDLGLEGL